MGNTSEQETIDRQNIQKTNREAKAKLHVFTGRNGNNCRSEFTNNPPTLEHLQRLKSKFLTPSVTAWLCAGSKGKITGTIGNISDVKVILDKLSANLGYPITSKKDSLLLRVFLDKTVMDLILKIEQAPEEQDAADVNTPVHVCSLFDNPELLSEAVDCITNLMSVLLL